SPCGRGSCSRRWAPAWASYRIEPEVPCSETVASTPSCRPPTWSRSGRSTRRSSALPPSPSCRGWSSTEPGPGPPSGSAAAASGAHTQVAFTVPDIAAEVAELKARGVVFEAYEQPKTVDGVATMPAGRAAWFKDPAGNLLGLIEFNEPI